MHTTSHGSILVVGRSADVLSAVKAGAGSREVQIAPDLESLRWLLRPAVAIEYTLIVYELQRLHGGDASEIAALLGPIPCPVVAAPRFGRGFGISALKLATRRNDVLVALDCSADLTGIVADVCRNATARGDTARIIAVVGVYVPSIARDCFAAAAVLGRERCTRQRIAQAIDLQLGTAEHHLRTVHAPTIRAQLRWRRSLGVVFRMLELGETEERAAQGAGWGSRPACSHAVKVCTGYPPAAWRAVGGFSAAVHAYAQVWQSRCADDVAAAVGRFCTFS